MQIHTKYQSNWEIHTAVFYFDHKGSFCHTCLTRSGSQLSSLFDKLRVKSGLFNRSHFYSLLLCSGRNMPFFSFTTSIITARMMVPCSWNQPAFPEKEIKIGARLSGADEVAVPGRWPLMTACSSLQIQVQSSLQVTDKGPLIPSKLKPENCSCCFFSFYVFI